MVEIFGEHKESDYGELAAQMQAQKENISHAERVTGGAGVREKTINQPDLTECEEIYLRETNLHGGHWEKVSLQPATSGCRYHGDE